MDNKADAVLPASTITLPNGRDITGEPLKAVFQPRPLRPGINAMLVSDVLCPLPAGLENFMPVKIVSVSGEKNEVVVECVGRTVQVKVGNVDAGWDCLLDGMNLHEASPQVYDWLQARLGELEALPEEKRKTSLHKQLLLNYLLERSSASRDFAAKAFIIGYPL